MSDLTDHTYEKLCADYDEIINESIVLDPRKDRTIFDISKYPHYENVISNWYEFFFDPLAEHSLRDLFLQSLVEIINEDKDYREFSMEGCYVKREFQTDERGFVDLVLYEQSEEGERFASAIIIENKIRAPVKNNLVDYYESVKVVEPDQKVGVVLSLHKIKDEDLPEEFINITHEKLLEAIQRKLGEYVVSAKLKYILYLQDFISNLEQMAKMQDYMKFYFDSDNAKKIDNLVNLRDQTTNYLRDDLKRAVERGNFEPKVDAEKAFRLAYSNDRRILFYLYYISSIRTEKKFTLSAWLYGEEVVEHWKHVDGRKKIKGNEYQLDFNFKQNSHGEGKNWAYLAEKKYEITDIENFGEEVFEFLKRDWLDFLENVSKILKQANNSDADA